MEDSLNRLLTWLWEFAWRYRHFILAALGLAILGTIVEKIFSISIIRHIVIGIVVVILGWLLFKYFR